MTPDRVKACTEDVHIGHVKGGKGMDIPGRPGLAAEDEGYVAELWRSAEPAASCGLLPRAMPEGCLYLPRPVVLLEEQELPAKKQLKLCLPASFHEGSQDHAWHID